MKALWIAALVTLLAACGGSSSPATTEAPTTSTPVEASTTTTASTPDLTAACRPDTHDGEPLLAYVPPDRLDPELVAEFERRFIIEVVEAFYDSPSTLSGQVLTEAARYDLVLAPPGARDTLAEANLLYLLDTEALPATRTLHPTFMSLADRYSVPVEWSPYGASFPGDLALGDATRIVLAGDPVAALATLTLLSDGQADVDSVRATAAELDPRSTIVARGPRAMLNAAPDPATVIIGPAAVVAGLADRRFELPQGSVPLAVDVMAVPSTANYPCTAHAFIEQTLAEPADPTGGWYPTTQLSAEAAAIADRGIVVTDQLSTDPRINELIAGFGSS